MFYVANRRPRHAAFLSWISIDTIRPHKGTLIRGRQMPNRYTLKWRLEVFRQEDRMRSGGTDLSQASAPSLSLFRLSPFVKTLRLNHAAHFSVGTGAYPIAPTEDYSARPAGDFSGGPKFLHLRKTKNPATWLSRARGFRFCLFLRHRVSAPWSPHGGSFDLRGELSIHAEIRTLVRAIRRQTQIAPQGSYLRWP